VFFSFCDSAASPQATVWHRPGHRPGHHDQERAHFLIKGRRPHVLIAEKRVTTHLLPSVIFLLRQRRVAAGSGLDTGLGTTIKNEHKF
jgi:hypothetical protein